MRTKRITRIHSPDSVNDKNWLKMMPKMDNFWLKIKNLRLYKTFRSLDLLQLLKKVERPKRFIKS